MPTPEPNHQLRNARQRIPSPRTPGACLGRQELAEIINAWVYTHHGKIIALDKNYVGKLENGRIRWPDETYRAALRAILNASTDTDLGFYDPRRMPPKTTPTQRQQFLHNTPDLNGLDQQSRLGHHDMLADHAHVPEVVSSVMNRRDLLTAVGGAAAYAALPAPARSHGPPAGLAAALTRYGAHDQQGLGGKLDLTAAVAQAKHHYQAGQYRQVSEQLPDVLATAAAVDVREPQLQVLAADAYQTACSVLLKYGDAALAMVAADRSMAAAERSGNPVTVGASARAMAHALAAGGHHERAVAVALEAAQQLDRARGLSAKSGLAVYGALLLRASVVAAVGEQRETALTALAEAHDAAARLRDGNHNAYWTYFCPANVLLHRVSVAVDLGDAGQAIEHAKHINPKTLLLAERKACLYVDIARAYLQWGKHEKAYRALRAAEQVAPQELVARPIVGSVMAELQQRCPPSIQGRVRQLADRVGV